MHFHPAHMHDATMPAAIAGHAFACAYSPHAWRKSAVATPRTEGAVS